MEIRVGRKLHKLNVFSGLGKLEELTTANGSHYVPTTYHEAFLVIATFFKVQFQFFEPLWISGNGTRNKRKDKLKAQFRRELTGCV